MGSVHTNCLENWLHVKNIKKCEVCDEEYRIEKILKYGKLRSLIPYIRTHKSLLLYNLGYIFIMFLSTMLANVVIFFTQTNWKHENFKFFITFYYSVVCLFIHYFFLIECFYEIYDIYNSWQTWRTSLFTIQII